MAKPYKLNESIKKRFSGKFRIDESGCWIWFACKFTVGYGALAVGHSNPQYAHRISWEIHRGPIPPKMEVCHKCDVKACVNPDHLFIGTHADNMKDAWLKSRRKHFKLYPKDVIEIRRRHAAGETSRAALAREYKVDPALIYRICERKSWYHVP